jgi:SAM-dependent methyltransferase
MPISSHVPHGFARLRETRGTLSAKVIVTAVAIVASCSRPTFSPTPMNVVDRMLELVEVTCKDVVYDLGSGDGRIVIAAAKKYGARGVGIELSPALVELAQAKAVEEGVASLVRFEVGDALKANLQPATVVTLFLSAEFNARLRPVLEQQLKPGTRIVSHDHPIGGWEPELSLDRVKETEPIPGAVQSMPISSRRGKLVHEEVHSMQPREHQPDYLLSEDAPHWHTIYLWKID